MSRRCDSATSPLASAMLASVKLMYATPSRSAIARWASSTDTAVVRARSRSPVCSYDSARLPSTMRRMNSSSARHVGGTLAVVDRRLRVAGGVLEGAELGIDAPDLDLDAEPLVRLERREPQRARPVVVAGDEAHHGRLVLHPGAERRLDLGDPLERFLEPPPGLDPVTTDAPEVAHRRSRGAALRVTSSWSRAKSSAARMFASSGSTRSSQAVARVQYRGSSSSLASAIDHASCRRRRSSRRELGARVRADRLEHREPGLGAGGQRRAGEARVEERVERARRRLFPGRRSPRAPRASRRPGRATSAASTWRAERSSRSTLQATVARIDRCRSGRSGAVRRQERQRLAEAPPRPLDAQDAHAGRGELDREREAVERSRDPGDRLGVHLRDVELRHDLARPLDVEPDGGRCRDGIEIGRRRVGNAERRDAVLVLERDVKRRPARREELELRDRVEQRGDVGERPGEVLEVVDHGEHARASGERAGERLDRRLALLLVDAEPRRDRRDRRGRRPRRGRGRRTARRRPPRSRRARGSSCPSRRAP